jgi:hypothetical protein
MENIMEVTTRVLQGPLLERLSLQTHESEGAIRRGMEQAVPLSIAGLAAHASSAQNAEQLLGALRAGNYPHADAVAIGQTASSPGPPRAWSSRARRSCAGSWGRTSTTPRSRRSPETPA